MVVGGAAIAGAVAHARGGRVRLKTGATFGSIGIAGSYAGSLVSAAVPANLLLAGFGLLMLAVATLMLLRRHGRAQFGAGPAVSTGARRMVLIAAAATGVGLVTGFFGVGGGFVVVPALVLVLGFDMPTAAGTSLVVIAVNSAAALAARAGHGGLTPDWRLIGVFGAGALAGALAGGGLAGRASPQRLSVAFSVLVVLVAGYILTRSLPGLV